MSPAGAVDIPFTFAFSKMQATTLNGGSVKIVDSRTFAASQTIAAAEVTVEPGAIRSVHISFLRPITPSLTQYTLQRAPRETSLNLCLKPFDAYFCNTHSGTPRRTSGASSCKFPRCDCGAYSVIRADYPIFSPPVKAVVVSHSLLPNPTQGHSTTKLVILV